MGVSKYDSKFTIYLRKQGYLVMKILTFKESLYEIGTPEKGLRNRVLAVFRLNLALPYPV